MSGRPILTDDAIRAALTSDADIHAPADLADAIRAAIEPWPRHPATSGPGRRGWRRMASLRVVAWTGLWTLLLVALMGALLVAGSRLLIPPPAAVGTYGGGPARTGVMPGPGPVGTPRVAWEVALGPTGAWSPAVVDGAAYVADATGHVTAVDVIDGRTRWRVRVGAPMAGGVTVADGLALAGDVDGMFHALDLVGGAERWTYDAGGRMPGSPAVVDGIAYVGTTAGEVHAIDLATGTAAWDAPARVPGSVSRAVAAGDGLVVVGAAGADGTGSVSALDAHTGQLRWSASVGSGSPSTPTISDGLVLVASGFDGGATPRLHAFDVATGATAWDQPFESPTDMPLHPAAVVDGRAYLVTDDGWLHVVDLATGRLAWSLAIEPGSSTNGAVVSGVLYVTGSGQDVVAVDIAGRTEVWRLDAGGSTRAPAVIDGRIIVTMDDGRLVAVVGG